jgi:hypothetical protein
MGFGGSKLTREVGSMIPLPVSYGVEVDSGSYDTNMRIIWTPVFEQYIDIIPTETGQRWFWNDIRNQVAAHANYNPNVIYMCMFKGILDTGEGKWYQFTQPSIITQRIFLDPAENEWRFFWMPMSGAFWEDMQFVIAGAGSDTMEITEMRFVPCIPVVLGAGFEELDTNADEGSADIGNVKCIPIPEFTEVGACKLYDRPDQVTGDRIYSDSGLTNGDLSNGIDAVNGLVRIVVRVNRSRVLSETVEVGYSNFGYYEMIARFTLMSFNSPYNIEIVENTKEMIHLRIFSQDASFTIKMRRGSPTLEIESNVIDSSEGMINDIYFYYLTTRPEFAWIKDALLTEKDGVHSRIQTAGSPYEFDPANPTNHYAFIFRRFK